MNALYANSDTAVQISEGTPLVVNAHRGLNVRQNPNAQRLGAIPDGSVIYATGDPELHRSSSGASRYWVPVKFEAANGDWINGWVFLRYTELAPSESKEATSSGVVTGSIDIRAAEVGESEEEDGIALELSQSEAVSETVTPPSMKLNVRVNSRARFRTGPGLNYPILGRMTNDTEVVVIGKPVGDWIPIQKVGTDEKGWMHSSLLESEGDINPIELAHGHASTSEETSRAISEYAADIRTEAGYVAECTDCQNGGNRQSGLPVSSSGYVRPVNGPAGSGFGRRTDPITGQAGRQHNGQDFRVPTGTPVASIRAGRIVQIETRCRVGNRSCGGGWGNHIIVDHGNGIRSVYAHLSQVNVRNGQSVGTGVTIGRSGNTGRSTGPHLHLEIHENGRRVNPSRYITL